MPAAAVLVAAGKGRRMGGEPKQFRLLDGRPTMCWATRPLLEALAGPLVVVLPSHALAKGEELLHAHLGSVDDRLRVVAGGRRRQDSMRAGLDALSAESGPGGGPVATVLVHDAVRPFASRGLVERVARLAVGGHAVVPAIAVADTLKEVDGDRVVRTYDRSRFVAAQTPQGFPYALLTRACAAAGGEATDCASLCERMGAPVTWIPGESLNRKLTEPEDWVWAERVIGAGWIRWEDRP